MGQLNSLIVLGRLLLASLFLLGGVNKILNFSATQASMQAVQLEPSLLLLILTIVLELGGGLLIAIGRWYVFPAALLLALFTLATNVYFHNFWAFEGEQQQVQLSFFFKNLSIAGGLFLIAAGSVVARKGDHDYSE
ncbi:MAG: DoxX family membrane protein [Pseudomonadota bacterium]